MEFNGTTFALEILNFLVLVWVLQRFLYKPVGSAIARRKAGIEKTIADAQAARAEAEAHKREFEGRLADWARERETAHAQLLEEIGAERARMLEALQASLEQERQKNRVQEERHAAQVRRIAEDSARARGAQFVARLLSRLAGADLERKITDVVREDLPHLAEAELQILRAAAAETGYRIEVTSRYSVANDQRDLIAQALGQVIGKPVVCEYAEDPDLLAGVHLTLGAWVLNANLRDELRFFAETPDHAG